MAATKDKSVPDTQESQTVYIATDTINHNGTRYVAGDELIDITHEELLALCAAGVAAGVITVKVEQP